MSKKASPTENYNPPAKLPQPVDVTEGIPDRDASVSAWKIILLAAIFLGWLTFLIYCWLAGGVGK